MALVIGLSGKIGSGKGTVAEYICEKYGAEQFLFSKILADILDRLYLPKTRVNLQKLGRILRSEFCKGVIVDAFEKDIKESKAKIKIVDGIRYVNEVVMLRKNKDNVLIYVKAPLEIRYERCLRRSEKGEDRVTFEEFRKADVRATESELGQIENRADYVVDNSGSIQDLKKKIDEIMVKMLK